LWISLKEGDRGAKAEELGGERGGDFTDNSIEIALLRAYMYKWMFLSGKLESKSACTPVSLKTVESKKSSISRGGGGAGTTGNPQRYIHS
jgi:hypothetical protein